MKNTLRHTLSKLPITLVVVELSITLVILVVVAYSIATIIRHNVPSESIADFSYQGELICEVISEPGPIYIAECGGSDMRMVSNNKEAVLEWANDIYIGIIMSELDVQCAIKE